MLLPAAFELVYPGDFVVIWDILQVAAQFEQIRAGHSAEFQIEISQPYLAGMRDEYPEKRFPRLLVRSQDLKGIVVTRLENSDDGFVELKCFHGILEHFMKEKRSRVDRQTPLTT